MFFNFDSGWLTLSHLTSINNNVQMGCLGDKMKGYDDQRDFYRMLLNNEVVVTVIDDEVNSNLFATCRDLSATGMAFEMEYPLAVSTHVRVKVDSSNSHVQTLDISGRVVRMEEESNNCYLICITIDDID
jgi:hypothetical protein